MTYHGGIEDGKAALATQILKAATDINKSPMNRLNDIVLICLNAQKTVNPMDKPQISDWDISPYNPRNYGQPPISEWSPTPDELG